MRYKTIAFSGTSLSSNFSCWGWPIDATEQLQVGSGYQLRAYDLGSTGRTAANGLSDVGRLVGLRPDIAVVEYAMNDAYTPNSVSVATFKTNLEAIVDSIAAGSPNTSIFLMTMNPAIAPGASTVPNLSTYYQGVRDTATLKSVSLIDNTPLWGTPTGGQMAADGIHPLRAPLLSIVVPNVVSALSALTR